MAKQVSSSVKIRITTSLNAELVTFIDRFLKARNQSRSQFIEDVLAKWHNEQKKRELENQIEAYYLSLSREEIEEDHEWLKITAQYAHKFWEE